MTTGLTVTVNGQPVPLDGCGWIQRRPCGCIVSAVAAVVETADDSGWVIATADQAHRHLNQTKRERTAAERAGITVSTTELITMQHYREHIGSKWECEQHAAAVAVDESTVCGKCRQPFASTDSRFDGRAFYLTPYCRGCVDRCHDNDSVDHRCVICA